MRMIHYLLVLLILSICSCTHKDPQMTKVYLVLDYKRVNKDVVKIWINDSLKFCSIYKYNDNQFCMKIDRVQKGNVKFKIELTSVDCDFYYYKQVVDTTFYYNTNKCDLIDFTYYKSDGGFRIYNNVDNPERWFVE